jgi:thymidylate kinase
MLARVRQSYLRQASNGGWHRIDADRDREVVGEEVFAVVSQRL